MEWVLIEFSIGDFKKEIMTGKEARNPDLCNTE